jgi:hypothetical protein
MTVFDLDKHEPITYLEMAGGPDVIKFDPGLGRIYAACYTGAISVFHQDDPQYYRKLEGFKGAARCTQRRSGPRNTSGLYPGAGGERKAGRPYGHL